MAIEPIKGFYVHDEETDTDGVALVGLEGVDSLDTIIGSSLLDVPCGAGAWSLNGSKTPWETRSRMCTDNALFLKEGDEVTLSLSGYHMGIVYQNIATVYDRGSSNSDTGWLSSGDTFIAPYDCFAKISFKKENNAPISSEEESAVRGAIKLCIRYPSFLFDETMNDDASALKKATDACGDGFCYFDYHMFEVGNMTNGVFDPNGSNKRFVTPTAIMFDYDITIYADDGFRFGVHFFDDDDNFIYDSGWTTACTVLANTKFKIIIERYPLTSNLAWYGLAWLIVPRIKYTSRIGSLVASLETSNGNKVASNGFKSLTFGHTWYINTNTGRVARNTGANACAISAPKAMVAGTRVWCDAGYVCRFFALNDGVFVYGTGTDWRGAGYLYELPVDADECYWCIEDAAHTAGLPVEEIQDYLHISVPADGIRMDMLSARVDALEDEAGLNYDYNAIGTPISMNKMRYNVELMSLTTTSIADVGGVSAYQGMTICNGVVFQLMSNDKVELVDYDTGASIAILNIKSDHGDTIDFSNEYYQEGDEFPLAYITADTTPAKVYVNRITREETTLVKTYIFPAEKTGYYAGHSLDKDNMVLYQVGYTENSFREDPNGTNLMIVSKWDLKDVTDNGDDTFTPAFVESFTVPFIYTCQGQSFFDGKIVIMSSFSGDPPTKVVFIDPVEKRICTIMSELPANLLAQEAEGVAFVDDGDKYAMVIRTNSPYFYKVTFA